MTRNGSVFFLSIIFIAAISGCTSSSPKNSIEPQNRGKVADINTKIAIAYMREGDYEPALVKLEKAIKANPSHAPAYSAMGLLYNQVGEFEKSDKYFQKALRIKPKDSAILNNYGRMLCQHKQYAKGQEMFLRANENVLYRTPEIALSNAGTCAMSAGDVTTAETHFRKALKINPYVAASLLQMSSISYSLDRYMPARGYLQRYLEVGKHNAQSLWLGIQIERELGDKDSLASYTMLLENEYPDTEQARLLLESKDN